jgi:prohibitin 2
MNGFIAVLFVALAFAGLLLFVARNARRFQVLDGEGRRIGGPANLIRTVLLGGAGLLALVLLLSSFQSVKVGHGLVIFNVVTKTFRMAPQGITWVVPLVSQVQDYDLRRLEYTMSKALGEGRRANMDDSLWSPTQEGLQVGIDITVWHHLDPQRVVQIHQKIGPEFEEKIIRPAISEYAVMDVYSAKRAKIQDEINEKLKLLVEKDGFMVDEVVLRDVRFTDDFAKAIEAKQIAQQSAEQMKYVLEKEQREAERKVIDATGRAKEALRQNPNYIRYLYVDKLSDKISVIVSDQNTIMDLKGMLDSKK